MQAKDVHSPEKILDVLKEVNWHVSCLSGEKYPRKEAKISFLILVRKKISIKLTEVSGFIKKRMSSWQRKGINPDGDALAK